jgi:hypothetical protein
MKTKLLYLFILVANSSCFLYVYKPQSIDKRLLEHRIDISRSDTSKIDFRGIYLEAYNSPQNSNVQIYNYYKFFPSGKAYHSKGFSGSKPTRKETEDFSSGEWSVYYIKGNNIYVEQFNGYNGYTLLAGFFNEKNKQIVFTDNRKLNGRIIAKEPNLYVLELIN